MITAILCIDDMLTWLPEALSSIASQRRQVDELILVKSRRTPEQADVFAKHFGATAVTQPQPGLAAARNFGISLATGDLIAFLDGDDCWLPEKIENQASRIEAEKLDATVGCLVRFSNAEQAATQYREDHFSKPVPALTPGGMLVRKSVFEKIGLFDNSYRIACDHEWFMRLLASGLNVQKTQDVVLQKRIHGGNLSNQLAAYRQEIMQILKNRS